MLMALRRGVIALGLMAMTAAAQSPHRLVVVVGWPTDPRVARQHADLANDGAALRERDVVVQDITPEAARRTRPELGTAPQAEFEILLVGKDGGVKSRLRNPVATSDIITLIDTMPMRRSETRR